MLSVSKDVLYKILLISHKFLKTYKESDGQVNFGLVPVTVQT